ncbi:MAG TPA: ATP-binding protein [Candidatus Saccharimonadia bacterium]|nr:ATP-binding protein [Candidatus Saccharimonadia bacterium]
MKLPAFTLNLPFLGKKTDASAAASQTTSADGVVTSTASAAAAQKRSIQQDLERFSSGLVNITDIIAPEAIEVDFNYQKINSVYIRTLFVAGYPRTVPANWLSPLINFPHSLDISMHIFPVESKKILDDLRRKITEMEAEISSDIKQGKLSNINTEIKLEDARVIQEQLAKGAERFYQFGLYVTITDSSLDALNKTTNKIRSMLGSLLIVSKVAALQIEDAFKTTQPLGLDKLLITRNMDTTSLATTFPFTSAELTSDTGVLYGINEHNDSLVVFDRFSMENANMVVFAKSGAGKSYAVKLEALRQLMFDAEVIILDPEHEYEELATAVGGEYINFTFSSPKKINPFDLSAVYEEGENELGMKIISVHTLLKIMMGNLSPTEDAMLDRALIAAYKAKGITPDPATQTNEPPLMEDLYKALIGMESQDAQNLAARLEKYIKGSFRGIFDQKSNMNITNQFTVFSVKEMEEELRPIAMFLILDFVWTRIKKNLKKRILIVDEAWYFMKYPDSASFVHSMAKRARKYYLGITTITQDVEDFLTTDYGKAIVTNSSLQFLMKQSSAAIPRLGEVFFLSEGERRFLLACDVGEGLFFAGQNHVALRVVASQEEHDLITTNPEEVLKRQNARAIAATQTQPVAPTPQLFVRPPTAPEPTVPAPAPEVAATTPQWSPTPQTTGGVSLAPNAPAISMTPTQTPTTIQMPTVPTAQVPPVMPQQQAPVEIQ